MAKRRLGTINEERFTTVCDLQAHTEDFWRRWDKIRDTISTASSNILTWTGWDEEEDTIKDLYCRVKFRSNIPMMMMLSEV